MILCEIGDGSALWLTARLQERGIAVDLLTAPALGAALRWEHRIDGPSASVSITLADGRIVSSATPVPIVNRLSHVPTERLRVTAGRDFDYAVQELYAFYLSWLHAWPAPVVNRPVPQGMSGNYRHQSEWMWLAGRAALLTAGWTQSDADPPESSWVPRPVEATAFVVGTHVVMPSVLPPDLETGCRALGALAGTTLLGIDFARPDGDWVVAGASPLPDLIGGGSPLVDAIAAALDA